jgi:uncharacterized cupin superfamily protein
MPVERLQNTDPHIFHLLQRDALAISAAPTGEVGTLFRGAGIEAVWVAKQGEIIDPNWFSQRTVDLILVVQGELRVEFAQADRAPVVLGAGDLLVLPADTRCRAYRWPREREEATIFFAVYPLEPDASTSPKHHTAQ